ncbi:3-keto-5-aminohexanoate cleavage protein [Yoonia sp. I 8.24]|uniref:3-keto-5-aminohexanoate cleavage protein n=1 Tax=Yoonia sp. I 8.24 TaxID=1537229 RepID=UPI001EDF63C5|nr:3-keto-5-aminohexanoate cleavage protein [Yoonia sp. I 8.24]MCG3266678.1 3-keto-5-aminohexanoate cleavage protein [Yoonia sp. I 8.24]
MADPFIMIAPSGARRSKADHLAIPISVTENIETAIACHAAGADALHLHVRDDEGLHSLDADRYLETLAELSRVLPDMPVQITTEAAGLFDVAAQLKCLTAVRPSWASISVREIDRSPELADAVYGVCADNGTKVQHILYGVDDIVLLAQRQAQGIIRPEQSDVIFVLGRYTHGQTSAPSDLSPFLDAMPARGNWMVCAFGAQEHPCLVEAAKLGGNLRVGFENSLTDSEGQAFEDNAASVSALHARLKGTP